jgi:hypothetical protein
MDGGRRRLWDVGLNAIPGLGARDEGFTMRSLRDSWIPDTSLTVGLGPLLDNIT